MDGVVGKLGSPCVVSDTFRPKIRSILRAMAFQSGPMKSRFSTPLEIGSYMSPSLYPPMLPYLSQENGQIFVKIFQNLKNFISGKSRNRAEHFLIEFYPKKVEGGGPILGQSFVGEIFLDPKFSP